MDSSMAEQVRRFNRVVTQRIGALDDHYLARDRPLGEARLLWEIGLDGADTRSLRTRLGLDSGYLSRLLRALETAGLAQVGVSPQDGRVRTVQLTEAGRRERALLDRRSDELAESLLRPLPDTQQARLVAAMHEVERLLTASLVDIDVVDPADPRVQYCLREYATELTQRFPGGFDPARSISATDEELRSPAGLTLIATLHAAPIGCGAVKFHPGKPSEIKRMWVSGTVRGLGIARRLLTELETHAAQSYPVVRLETNETLQEAIALYRSAGYQEVDPFNEEPYAHHWFEKRFACSTCASDRWGRPDRLARASVDVLSSP